MATLTVESKQRKFESKWFIFVSVFCVCDLVLMFKFEFLFFVFGSGFVLYVLVLMFKSVIVFLYVLVKNKLDLN